MRGATPAVLKALDVGGISIHAPHAGSDVKPMGGCAAGLPFQSTLPMRGATISRF